MSQTAKAELFHKLHQGPDVLVLPNAWDAASAAVAVDAGAKAVATSSAALAWAHGHVDGDVMPLHKTCAVVAEIVRVTDAPVSADFEGGFTDDLGELAANVGRILEAGAVGINFEDGGRSPEQHAEKIAVVRAAAGKAGVTLFINARTDVYLRGLAEGEAAVEEVLRRAKLYVDAGASGIFVPGASDADSIRRLAAGVGAPLNIMSWPGAPDAAGLRDLGVRRLSAGTATFSVAYAALAKAVTAFVETGDSDALLAAGQGAPRLQKRFSDLG